MERRIDDELPFEIPENWCWCRLVTIAAVLGGKRIPAGRKLPSYSQYERALEELDSIGVKRINVMVDSDYQVKEEVRKARDRYIEMGAAAGFEMAPITWTQKQKGVDDLYKHLFRDK